MSRKEIEQKLQVLNVLPKRSLGQNFLHNPQVIEKILKICQSISCEEIIEIGPGLGALTEGLSQIKKIKLIELDRTFASYWIERCFFTYEEDALKLNWEALQVQSPALLVSNLPYQISSSIVIERSIAPFGVEAMVLMFQKEVAQRILEKVNGSEYGLLSVIAQTFWEIQYKIEIGPNDYFPAPQVASRVLVFQRKKSEKFKNHSEANEYLKFVKAAFSQRRKYLIKNIAGAYHVSTEVLAEFFKVNQLNPQMRAQELTVEGFVNLFYSFESSFKQR